MIDWNSKSTPTLQLILDSVLRYKGNAKTDREKRNSEKTIATIRAILEKRKSA